MANIKLKEDDKTVSEVFKLPASMRAELKILCELKGIKKSELIRLLVKRWIAQNK